MDHREPRETILFVVGERSALSMRFGTSHGSYQGDLDMTAYANSAAFDKPGSRMSAMGADLSRACRSIVDLRGTVLALVRTGGMINPCRCALGVGTTIYRFKDVTSPREVVKGSWWIEKREFERLVHFAESNEISIGMAMRLLCLVPPEWNAATILVRGRVSQALLAWRGLADSVVTPMQKVRGTVALPHNNDIAERRLHQLFIPGLYELGTLLPVVSIEEVTHLDRKASERGFLYL